MFKKLRDKFIEKNEVLANDHRAWRDEDLDQRAEQLKENEQKITLREAALATKLADIKKSEARWVRRKLGFGLVTIVVAIPSFTIGVAVGSRGGDKISVNDQHLETSSVVKNPSKPENWKSSENATDNVSEPTETASSTPPDPRIRSTSENMSFDNCVSLIQRKSTELGVAPTNIVETDILRMVRFNATDGSVVVSCSKLDNKMVLTTSPYKG